jgi:long-chain acyl-CoA synthetase
VSDVVVIGVANDEFGEEVMAVTDRDADVIVSGGVNIYPAEVEQVLLTHPLVSDVVVIGVANDEFGEEVMAVIEAVDDVEPGDALTEELIAHCREHLAHFKCPRSVDVIDRIPRQDNGKLYRNQLRDQYRRTRTGAPPE